MNHSPQLKFGLEKISSIVWYGKRLLALGFAWSVVNGNVSAVEFTKEEIAGKSVTVCRVDVRKERLQLFYRDEAGQPFRRFDRLASWLQSHGKKLVFAMNAGMYHGDLSAVGLAVVDGQQRSPLNTANGQGNFFLKPNGVFSITESGAQIVESSEYPKLRERSVLATQSGPILVWNGRIHPAFSPNSESRLFRNGVGVPSPGIAIFVISDVPVNFYEFAELFRDKLHCRNALFLDGTVSSLYAEELKRNDFRMDLGPIIGLAN